MAISAFKGTITAPAATGNQSYTDPGFTPVAILFWWTKQTAVGFAADQRMGIGFCAGSGGEFAMNIAVTDNVATTAADKAYSAAASINVHATTGAAEAIATWVSFDVGVGFTLNWTATTNGLIIHYLALGGSGVANAAVGNILGPTATGVRDEITTLGFTPTLLFTLPMGVFGAPPTSGSAHAHLGLGAAMSSTQRWCCTIFAENGAVAPGTNFQAKKWQRSDSCVLTFETSGAELQRVDFVDFVPSSGTGWRFDWVITGGVARRYAYLALRITDSIDVGVFNKDTGAAPVTQSVTTSFQPNAVVLGSFGIAAQTGNAADCEMSIGGGDGTNEGNIWTETVDATINTEANQETATTKALALATSPSTIDAEADHAMLSNGFQLTWTTNNGTAAEIAYVAIGTASAATAVQSQYGPTIFRVQPRRWG